MDEKSDLRVALLKGVVIKANDRRGPGLIRFRFGSATFQGHHIQEETHFDSDTGQRSIRRGTVVKYEPASGRVWATAQTVELEPEPEHRVTKDKANIDSRSALQKKVDETIYGNGSEPSWMKSADEIDT